MRTKTWASGVSFEQFNIDIDTTLCLPDPQAQLHSLEVQSDLSSSINYYEKLADTLHTISQILAVATGKLDNVGQFSGGGRCRYCTSR